MPCPDRRHAAALLLAPLVLTACDSQTATDSATPAASERSAAESPAPAAMPEGTESVPADGLVVRVAGSAASRYPVGTRFAGGSLITLAEGDSLVLFNADGTRTLSGPGTFAVGDLPAAASSADARATTLGRVADSAARNDSRSSAAAARMPPRPPDQGPSGAIDTAGRYAAALFDAEGRTAAAATRRTVPPAGLTPHLAALPQGPGLWSFALGSSGTHCLPSLNDIAFVRRGGGEALTISVSPAGGRPRTLTMAAGRSSAGWTGPFLTAGTRYRIAVEGGPASEARFVAIGAPPADAATLARQLTAQGCTRQAQRLARMMGATGIDRDDIAIAGSPAVARPPLDRPRPVDPIGTTVRPVDIAPPPPDRTETRPDVRPSDVRPRLEERPIARPDPRIITSPDAPADIRRPAPVIRRQPDQ